MSYSSSFSVFTAHYAHISTITYTQMISATEKPLPTASSMSKISSSSSFDFIQSR